MKAWLGSVVLGMAAGLIVALLVNAGQWFSPVDESGTSGTVAEATQRDTREDEPAVRAALRYAHAVRDGDGQTAAAMTQWMADRLERVRLESGDPDVVKEEKERLQKRAVERAVEGNRIRREGVDDAYVFAPGTSLQMIDVDDGPQGLDRPVQRRTWIRVTYPSPMRALVDREGRPIHSLVAGVSISNDGMVLKAGILGNVEIDYRSISYDWLPAEGG